MVQDVQVIKGKSGCLDRLDILDLLDLLDHLDFYAPSCRANRSVYPPIRCPCPLPLSMSLR